MPRDGQFDPQQQKRTLKDSDSSARIKESLKSETLGFERKNSVRNDNKASTSTRFPSRRSRRNIKQDSSIFDKTIKTKTKKPKFNFSNSFSGLSFKTLYEKFVEHPNMDLVSQTDVDDNENNTTFFEDIKNVLNSFWGLFSNKTRREEKADNFFAENISVDGEKNIKFDIPIPDSEITESLPVSDEGDTFHRIFVDKSNEVNGVTNADNADETTSFEKYVETKKKVFASNISIPESIKYISTPINNVSHSLKDKLIADKKRLRVYKTKKFMFSLLGACACFVLGWIVYGSSVFALAKSDITLLSKTPHIEQKVIRDSLEQYVGVPLPRLSVSKVESFIEEKFIWVKEAEVSRQWPNGIAITVKEREGVAVVKDGEGFVLLDDSGVKLETTDKPSDGVPLLNIPLGNEKTKDALNSILNILGALPIEERSVVVQAKAVDKDNVEFELQGGVKVIWGSNDNNDMKAKVLSILRTKQAKVIDVSTPSKPVTIL